MTLCWAANADDRPTFTEIVPMFDNVLRGSTNKTKQHRYSEQPESTRPKTIERSKTENKYVREWDSGVRPTPAQRKPRKSTSRTRH